MTHTPPAERPNLEADVIDFDQALNYLLDHAQTMTNEMLLPLAECLGKVLARPVEAGCDIPPVPISALDGYAINTADLADRGETCLPISQRIPAGQMGKPLATGTAARIFTGAAMPANANAVLAQESAQLNHGMVCFSRRPTPLEDVKATGSDLKKGDRLLNIGRRLHPQDLALVASAGINQLAVYRPLKVAILCTGDELIEPGQPLPPGSTYNANRYLVPAQIQVLGMDTLIVNRVADTLIDTQAALINAMAQADVVLTTGGVSVGEEDYIRAAIKSLGELHIWRVNMKPGKPFTFGLLGMQKTPILGLPGNPVSAFLNFALLARPFLLRCQGIEEHQRVSLRLPAGFDWPTPRHHREFLRARIDPNDPLSRVTLYPNQGSSALISTAWANGIAVIHESQTLSVGDLVEFIPLSSMNLY
ncbi:MAG: molybdopterin molybdotransferase MoeA [Halothiobacillus sp.]